MGKTEKFAIMTYAMHLKLFNLLFFVESEHCGKFAFQRNGFFQLLTLMLRQEI